MFNLSNKIPIQIIGFKTDPIKYQYQFCTFSEQFPAVQNILQYKSFKKILQPFLSGIPAPGYENLF
jgi:hypothetical protein